MSDDNKIRITLDDLNSAEVDRKLQQQSALNRATVHYQQQTPLPGNSGVVKSGSLWRHSLVYMTLFGFLGGLCAWIPGEAVWQVMNFPENQARRINQDLEKLREEVDKGDLPENLVPSRLEQLREKYPYGTYAALITDQTLTEAERDQPLAQLFEDWELFTKIASMFLLTVAGISIAFFLSIADGVMGRNLRDVMINGAIGLCLGLVGGILVALTVDSIYHGLSGGSSDIGMGQQIFARAVAWAFLGIFLAVAPGIAMRSSKKLIIGLCGGGIGGLVGGVLFDPVVLLTGSDWMSRLVGLTSIGAVAGLATGLIENVAKTGWLKVTEGLIAGKQFILYKNPTRIGSSPQCEIYLFKDPRIAPHHAAIHRTPHGFEIQDLQSSGGTLVNGSPVHRTRLRHLDQVHIGGTTFLFQEKQNTSPSLS
ncbi:MAG TPA: FHA domain-containing protein [Planctomicrobium sp.]|nr:FHA domain-containing protein [Planctomicrobium sp.]